MKKNLLLMMMSCPIILTAQNGVTVSGLAVNAGSPTTVTFNVNWQTPMPVALWSDTVWVFVDYNDVGIIKRLPLLPGATLTVTSAPGVGKVIEVENNNQGVWVAGNARSAGSFSATVQLLTATADLAGACVYASNYPPVGEYTAADKIEFTGTPEYKVILERYDKSTYTVTVSKNESLLIPNGEAALSFTDKTGAPGTINNNAIIINGVDVSRCISCCWNGTASTWVSCYVTTYTYPFNDPKTNTGVPWSGNGFTIYTGARSSRNGRANTAAITASNTTTNAVQLCKNLGDGWYLPAYEELVNMSTGSLTTPLNGLAGAGLLAGPAEWHRSSTEACDNDGQLACCGGANNHAMLVKPNGTIGCGESYVAQKTDPYYVQCAWRPL